ncbi:MAG: C40 family peptidase [Akkermansiaceae bacterium]|nr:C40 family peptidase [Armatimonadota bacterium]
MDRATRQERKLRACVAACRKVGVRYGLGAKASKLSATPGTPFTRIDCSGFVRWAVYMASGGEVIMPDGSWFQEELARKQGFKKSTSESCLLKDGRVRLAYWKNKDQGGISHIALVLNGKTLESHDSRGPNRRTWSLDTGWMRDAEV